MVISCWMTCAVKSVVGMLHRFRTGCELLQSFDNASSSSCLYGSGNRLFVSYGPCFFMCADSGVTVHRSNRYNNNVYFLHAIIFAASLQPIRGWHGVSWGVTDHLQYLFFGSAVVDFWLRKSGSFIVFFASVFSLPRCS